MKLRSLVRHLPPAIAVAVLLALASPAAAADSAPTTPVLSDVRVEFVDDDLRWTPRARAAVLAAARTWGRTLGSTVPIEVRATAGTIDGVYAYAGPVTLHRNKYASRTVADDVFEPAALANARLGRDVTPFEPDIEARFDLRVDLYLGTDGRTPPHLVDLQTLALHELGHGLGFNGSAGFGVPSTLGREGTAGTSVIPGSRTPFSYDRFTCTRTGSGRCVPLMSLADGSPELARAFESDALFWSGARATAANGGRQVRLHAPSPVMGGASYVHLDEATFSGADALMTPFLPYGEAMHAPGRVVVAMLADTGWRVAPQGR